MIEITLNRIWGSKWSMEKMRLSHGSISDTTSETIGPKDWKLAKRLVTAGPSHAKFLRTIVVWVTIQAPRYWWLQFDTYKVGTTALSESTMHTIMSQPLRQNDFAGDVSPSHLEYLNRLVASSKFTEVKANLPEGFLQMRGVCLNYQVLRTIYSQRRNHRLKEWQVFCDWIELLPYASLLTKEEQ